MRSGVRAVGFLLVMGISTSVLAQTAPDPDRALTLGQEAMALYNQEKFAEAEAKLIDAEAAAHSPVFLLYQARAAARQGKYAVAHQRLSRIVKEELPADAHPSWIKAKDDARADLAGLLGKVGVVRISVVGPGAESASVKLDGAEVPAAERSGWAADPGTHTIEAQGGSGEIVKRTIDVAAGEQAVELRFPEAAPTPSATATATATASAARTAAPQITAAPVKTPGSLAPGLIGIGGGVVSGAIGTGLFLRAVDIANEVSAGYDGTQAPSAEERAKAEEARSLARAATGLAVASGIFGAAGIVLISLRPGGAKSPVQTVGAPGAQRTGSPEIPSIRVGPTGVWVTGRF